MTRTGRGARRREAPRRSRATAHAAPCALLLLLAAACGDAPRTPEVGESAADAPDAAVPEWAAGADSIVRAWVRAERIPGAVLLAADDDGARFERAYGWARLYDYGSGQYPGAGDGGIARRADPVPMTTGTVFDLASVTKVMATTMAVMRLVDEGALDLDAPVSTWLPDFTGDGKEAITPRLLLTHRAGLAQWQPTYYHAATPREAYAYIRDVPLEWAVGRERHYSDLGFMLLGLVVERVSGSTLDVFVRDEIYGPLGLTHTGFRPVDDGGAGGRGSSGPEASRSMADPGPRVAATSHGNPFERRMVHDPDFGYRIAGDPDAWNGWRERTLEGEVNDGNAYHAFGGVAGHAGLFSTAADLEVLLRLLLREGRMNGRQVLSAETIREFLASTGDAQALGWQLPDYAPAGAFAHTGFTGTFVLGDPGSGRAIVLLTNRQNVGVDAETQYPDVGPLQRAVTAALTSAR